MLYILFRVISLPKNIDALKTVEHISEIHIQTSIKGKFVGFVVPET